MDKRRKEASNSASFEALNQKKIVQSRSRVLHLPPAHTATSGVGSAPQPPSGLSPGHTLPSRQVRKSRGPPPQRVSQQGDLLFVLAPPAAAGALINPCLKKKSEIFFLMQKSFAIYNSILLDLHICIMEHFIPLFSLLREFPRGLSLL